MNKWSISIRWECFEMDLTNIFVYVLTILISMRLTAGQIQPEVQNNLGTGTPVGKFYSLSTCDFRSEPGYTCTSCTAALRCYPLNVAVRVDCHGWFPYCRFGHCSMTPSAKCTESDINPPKISSTTETLTEDALETTSNINLITNAIETKGWNAIDDSDPTVLTRSFKHECYL